VANKLDVSGAREKFVVLQQRVSGRFKILGVSSKAGWGIAEIPRTVFSSLDVVRIYTRKVSGEQAQRPMIMKGEVTVGM